MNLFPDGLMPTLLGGAPTASTSAPTSTGQAVSDVIAGLALLMVIVNFVVNQVQARRQRDAVTQQGKDTKEAIVTEATRRDEEIEKLRKESVRRDQELDLLKEEAENRRTEIDLLTKQVEAAQLQAERATKAQANKVQIKNSTTSLPPRGITLSDGDRLWSVDVENHSDRAILEVRGHTTA